jgi:hypothetical protein
MCTVKKVALLFLPILASVYLCAQTDQAESTDPSVASRLAAVKSVCIGPFVGDASQAAAAREVAVTAMFSTKRFRLTENCDKADVVLKGAVLEKTERRVRAEGESTDFGVAAGGASVSRNSGRGGFGAAAGGSGETLYSSEDRSQATVTLRLVDAEGDILWAYTQDSPGGKTKSALVDAIERAVRQLMKEVEKAEAARPLPGP